MTALERHCRWLLLAYPRWYRADRSDEIAGTLLEAAEPGRTWPSARDIRALILAGLRARAGMAQRRTAAADVAQALLLAAVLVLATYSATDLGFVRGTFPSMLFAWNNLALGLATLASMVGAWYGPPRAAAVLALATACLWLYQPPGNLTGQDSIPPVLALVLIAILALRRQRLPRSWLWLCGTLCPVNQLNWLFPSPGPLNWLGNFGPFIIVVGLIAWCLVDVRPMLAVALASAIQLGAFFIEVLSGPPRGYLRLLTLWPWELIEAGATALAIAAIWRLVRRQAVL